MIDGAGALWRWPVAALAVAGAAAALALVPGEAGRFVASATYVIQADAADEDDQLRATSNLSDAPHISATFAHVSESELITDLALDRAGLDQRDRTDFEVDASIVAGSNLLRISVAGPESDSVRELADAVGAETTRFIDELDDLYDISLVDPPTDPEREDASLPFAAAAIGATIGAALGLIAYVAARIRRRRRSHTHPVGPGMRDEAYTGVRLSEEISRTNDTGVPFLFTVMEVLVPRRGPNRAPAEVGTPSPSDLPVIERALDRTLRPHDHLGRLDSVAPGVFAAILPGFGEEEADEIDEHWRTVTVDKMTRPYGEGTQVSVKSCCYGSDEFTGDPDAQNMFAELL